MITRRTAVASLLSLTGPAFAADPVKVNVGHTNAAADVGFFVADKRGYFRDEGIAPNFIAFDSGARMIAPFASGDLDAGGGAPSAALYNAVARGVSVKIVADKTSTPPGRPSQSVMVRKDLVESGRYKTLKDLKGLKLASNAPGAAGDGTVAKIFELTGLKDGDIERIYMGYPQQLLALKNGAVDAALPAEPTATEMELSGIAVRAVGDDKIHPNHQISVVLYSAQFAARKELATKFLRAYLRGLRDYNDAIENAHLVGPKGEAIIAILTEYSLIKDPAVYRAMSVNACDPDGKVDLPSLSYDLDIFRKEGLIEGKVSLDDVLDPTFAQAVVKELGAYKR
jgi:NitT/TauT family transport system substrate-binding protein